MNAFRNFPPNDLHLHKRKIDSERNHARSIFQFLQFSNSRSESSSSSALVGLFFGGFSSSRRDVDRILSPVPAHLVASSDECLHILKYLASHRPAGTSKYIRTVGARVNLRERGMHTRRGRRARRNEKLDAKRAHIVLVLAVSLSFFLSSHARI